MRAPPRKKGISRHRGRPHRAVFSSRSIQFPARTGVAFGLINTCRRCKQVSDPYICQERSGEWCGHGTRNLLFQESIEDEASRCFFSPFPELAENLLLLLPLSPLPRRVFKTRTLSLSKNFWREPRNHCAGRVRVDSLTVASSPLQQAGGATILQLRTKKKSLHQVRPLERRVKEEEERDFDWKIEKVCNIICRFT